MPGRNEGVDARHPVVRHEELHREHSGCPEPSHAPPGHATSSHATSGQSVSGHPAAHHAVPDVTADFPDVTAADSVSAAPAPSPVPSLTGTGPTAESPAATEAAVLGHRHGTAGPQTPDRAAPRETAACPTCDGRTPSRNGRLLAALRASESRFRAVFADAGIGMALIDPEDRIIEVNPAFAAMLGCEPSDFVRRHIHDVVEPEDTPRRLYRELIDGRRDRIRVEKRLKHRDGRSVWGRVTISLIRDSGGDPLYTLAMVEDVTEQRLLGDRLAYQALHDPLTRLPNRTLFFERLDAAFLAGRSGPRRTVAGRMAATDGPTAGRPGTGRLGATGLRAARGPGTAGVGAVVPSRPGREPGGQPSGNGSGSGSGSPRIGLCYIDLDGFAAINETLGHHIGDQLLVAVAARLENGFARRERQLVARLGGDEFAVLITDSEGAAQLTTLAGKLIEVLERPFEISGHRLVVTASIGVVERPVDGTSPTDLLKDADSTLYWSKADGRARWTLYDPARGAHQLTRQLLSTALRPALERGEFVVEYQPLVGLSDGLVHGAEALVRWRHPRYGTLSPDRFIPLAEESGAIVPLGKWVLEESCRQARRWLAEFPDADTFVSVNLAARQIWDSDVVADVAEVLRRTGLPAGLLQLEITESALLGPGGRPLQALQALADMGIRIAIDDFGTGYSNLAYLSRLPVHVLKLAGTFVEGFRDHPAVPAIAGRPDIGGNTTTGDMTVAVSGAVSGTGTGRPAAGDADSSRARRTEADEQIVTAMVQLAHVLGLTVTAEGIENAAQAERLRLTGCDTAQGWYFARPGAAELVAAMLREDHRSP